MTKTSNLGFPRVGLNRELKRAQEAYWKGNLSLDELKNTAKELRQRHWALQKDNGIDVIPSNDFSFYDHVLDMISLVGAIPERYNWDGGNVDLDLFFAMARGRQDGSQDVVAMEMTKWFDTNYHYIVPEFKQDIQFKLSATKIFDEFNEAKEQGVQTRPVILGPVSFLLAGKSYDDVEPLSLLNNLLPVYIEILEKLKSLGAVSVQIDEPFLVLDQSDEVRAAYKTAYEALAQANGPDLILTTYFGDLRDNLETALSLPVAGFHFDFVTSPQQVDTVLNAFPEGKTLSAGVVNGRNIWKVNLEAAQAVVTKCVNKLGSDNVIVGPSCSLLHSPVDLDVEEKLDTELKSWLSFAKQKLAEISLIGKVQNQGAADFQDEINANKAVVDAKKNSTRIHNQDVKNRVAALTPADAKRHAPFNERIKEQNAKYNFPLLPTTSIGSFPQTQEIRKQRASFKRGEITQQQYDDFLAAKTEELIKWQDKIGFDVPVHGEYERNDMVEYFGEQLEGFAFTQNGWVQSYGSRCVKPPVIFGDVSRPEAMTVRWSAYAQKFTNNPVKGMLTGPITILKWSFVRDDQPIEDTTRQIALAIRDEVKDLETAGITIIQIDEPAFRECLPLRKADWAYYFDWSVTSFRISSSGIDNTTQIHTHMCYSEFNDIIQPIADLDADVISIETSRSAMELLEAFVDFNYPNEIGPGVYDIHSPRVPNTEEMVFLLEKALKVLDKNQVWVNPDCGLKTRGWEEVETSLVHMIDATKQMREKYGVKKEEMATA